jgi:Histidine kinase-, DNA gyrase B-, and HSP90-like ATPase
VGETRVDLQHLLEDLRDAYTGSLEETILTEVIANTLDSGAARVRLLTDSGAATLTIIDDGRGMQRRELARYHDIAASTKQRGEGIGFAGVGIKLGLLVSREVVTETRRGATHVATRWHLASRHRAPWKWVPPSGLTSARGTAVQMVLTNQLSPLLDSGWVEETVRRHFEPLLDSAFSDVLRRHYPNGVTFDVDGRELVNVDGSRSGRVPIAIRLGRRRTPSALGYVERNGFVRADREGIAISTFGKVIKRGWDWLGLTPTGHGRVTGLIEASDLAACLTLSKNDFIRSGARGATYLAYRKAIQEVVSRQLAAWGDHHDGEARPRMVRLERDLERVLEDLAEDFPLLRSLVDRRAGGQKRLPMPGRGGERVPAPLFASAPVGPEPSDAIAGGGARAVSPVSGEPATSTPDPPGPSPGEPPSGEGQPREPELPTPDEGQRHHAVAAGALDTTAGRRRPARYGLLVQFESRPGESELGRLVDSTIWINDVHPAYTRAIESRSLGYHTALTVALALAPLAVEPSQEHSFITQFLAQWGGSATGKRSPRRRHSKK